MVLTTDHKDKIRELLSKATDGQLGKHMGLLMDFLLDQGLAVKQQIQCQLIGVHHQNRDGMGVDVGHVQSLASSIHGLGYVPSTSNNVAVEIPVGHEGAKIRKFNADLQNQSGERLGMGDTATLRYASVQGSHTNQVFRAFMYSAKHSDESLTIDGRLSLLKISKEWADAISNGVSWIVVSQEHCSDNIPCIVFKF